MILHSIQFVENYFAHISSMWWLIGTTAAVVIAAVYWFYFRDDGGWDEPSPDLVIKPVWDNQGNGNSSNNKKKKEKQDGIPVRLIYYSQTGTAEEFSHRLEEDLSQWGFAPEVCDAEEYDKESMTTEKAIIFLVATYGEGDPPDNASEFHEWLLSEERESEDYSNIKFAVFGLGNKTYDHFNAMARIIDKRMEKLGATRFYNKGEGDDDANIENDFLVWKKGFSAAVCKEFNLPPPGEKIMSKSAARRQKMIVFQKDDKSLQGVDINNISRWRKTDEKPKTVDAKTPYLSQIKVFRELHTPKSDRSCLHVEVATNGILHYSPGDHLGVYPENNLTLVHKLASLLSADLDQIISVQSLLDVSDKSNHSNIIVGPCTLKAALLQYYDITSTVKKGQLRVFAQYAADETEKNELLKLASDDPDKQEFFDKEVGTNLKTVIEILKDYKSIKVPLDHFLESLPKLQPRYYSISSSSSIDPTTVHLTAVVVDYVTPLKKRVKGVATGWLAEKKELLEQGGQLPQIPAFIRKSNFRLPASPSTPVIMIGPGTGLAPFRGFIQELQFRRKSESNKDKKFGESILFFGCRHPEKDYIYRDELEGYASSGIITELHVAFSRFTDKKIYVQNKMREGETPEKLWKLLSTDGCIYVCGDARLMATDVSATLQDIIIKHGGKTPQEAKKFLEDLQSKSRYSQDVWS